jgi:hypothetical protein
MRAKSICNSRNAAFLPKTPTGDRSIPPAKLQDHHQCSDFPQCRFAPTRKGKRKSKEEEGEESEEEDEEEEQEQEQEVIVKWH